MKTRLVLMIHKNSYLASLFLAPLILNNDDLGIIYLKNCLGTFYCDTNKPEWENKIIFAFELKDTHSLKITEEIFNKHPYAYDKYIEHLNNTTYYIYAYTIPPHLKRDVDYLINGEYTKLSDTARSLLRNSTTMSWLLNYYEAYFTKKVGMTFNTFHEDGILNLKKISKIKEENNDTDLVNIDYTRII